MRVVLILWIVGLGIAWFWVRGHKKHVLRLLEKKSPQDAKNFRMLQSRFGVRAGLIVQHSAGAEREALQAEVNRSRVIVIAVNAVAFLWPILLGFSQGIVDGFF